MITARGVGVTLMSMVFTLALCGAIIMIGPGAFGARALAIVLICPLAWGLAMFYTYWDEHPWRPLLVLTLCSVAFGTIMFTIPEPL